ncbi:MAG: hypothetical protein WD023_02450 [Ilumatobacteraceae bacterium]
MSLVTLASPVTDSAVSVWDDLLRGYAAVLDEQRAFILAVDLDEPLDGEALIVATFDPPANAPAVPESMHGRVRALLAETEGLAELASAVLAAHPLPNRHLPIASSAGGGAVDQRI